MSKRRTSLIALPALILGVALTGCEQEGPMERMGEKMDDAVEETRDKVGDAIESPGPVERAGSKIDESIEQAGESLNDAANEIKDATRG